MIIQINAMREEHLEQAFGLTQQLTWPHRLADWRQALQLGEGVVAEQEGEVLGTASCWRWGSDYASLGLVIVADQAQGKGLGRQLMQTLLQRLEGYNVRLHATEMGMPLYATLGFAITGGIAQHQCRELGEVDPIEPGPGQQLRPATPDDLELITVLDRQAHGQYRRNLFVNLFDSAERILLLEEQGTAAGFACLRRFGHGYLIGPVICRDLPQAKVLISTLLVGLAGQFVRIDTDCGYGLGEWLNSQGLIIVDRGVTMVRGVPWQPDGMLAFGLMSQAMS